MTQITPGDFKFEAPVVPVPVVTPSDRGDRGDTAVNDRIDRTLEQLEALGVALEPEVDFEVPALGYELPKGFLLTVVIPVFNERDTVPRLLARVRSLPLPMEIIVVDDCSTDGTRETLEKIKDVFDFQLISQSPNQGKGAALRAGFSKASGTHVVIQDADLEYDPRDIPRLIEPLVKNQADVVYGSRFLNEESAVGSSLVHRIGNGALTWLSNLATGLQLTDMETCYKVFPRELIQGFELKQDRFGFEPEITAKVAKSGVSVKELPISYHARDWDEGKKIGIRDGLNALYCILRYRFAR